MKRFRLLDKKRRHYFKNSEFLFLFYRILKSNSKNVDVGLYEKNLRSLPFALRLHRINNICIITGRVRSIYRFNRVSRLVFKGMDSVGYLPGIQRSSW